MSQRSSIRAGRAVAGNGRRRRSGLHTRPASRLRHRRGLRIVAFVLASFSALAVVGVAIVFAEYQNLKSQLPDATTLAAMEPPLDTHVTDRAGTLIGVLHNSDFRHEHIAIGDISPWVIKATVDVEDRHFYENSSWDLPRIIKAAYQNLRHESNAGGASTITEQLAKISFLSPERSLDRKIKQVILGAEIESSFRKDQILEMYLNRIAYGNHAIGIETAAQTFFLKSARDLDLAEASMLAGLPNSPTAYNPLNHDANVDVNPLAKVRQKVVLQAMVTNGDITQAQAEKAAAEPLSYHQWWESEPYNQPYANANFMQFLRDWLDQHYGDAYIKPGGWDIVASIDPQKQQLAQSSLKTGVGAIAKQYNAHDGALVSLDPKSGEVLAMVGAWNPDDATVNDQNLAYQQRQPGSTIKLFTYTTAIASREFTMTSPILDAPVTLPGGYSPHNYDQHYHGTCELKTCLGNSFNVPAVKTEYKVGIPMITDLEIAAGLKTLSNPNNRPWATLWPATLGGIPHGLTPLELADGVATIADMGVQHDPMPVVRITERATGKVVFADNPLLTGHRVVPADVAFIMAEITSNDHNRYAEFGPNGDLTLKDRRVSAKTGTTENFTSNWTVGWTPDLVGVVFVGNPAQSCLNGNDYDRMKSILARRHSDINVDDYAFSADEVKAYGLKPVAPPCGPLQGSTGITGAAPIWNSYMKQALAGTPKHWYTKPPDVIAEGSGDDANFFLAGTQAACYYYAPQADPNSICVYSGTAPPVSATPPASPTPAPGGPPGGPPGGGPPTLPPTTATPKPHP